MFKRLWLIVILMALCVPACTPGADDRTELSRFVDEMGRLQAMGVSGEIIADLAPTGEVWATQRFGIGSDESNVMARITLPQKSGNATE